MANQLDVTVQNLRDQLLSGRFSPRDKLRETALASELDVSRTIVRLTLGELEREGLVEREPNKGFRVRSYAAEDVTDAILVRGELEGMAARCAAETGLSDGLRTTLESIVADMDALIETGFSSRETQLRWVDLNGDFHDTIITASGNRALRDTVTQLSRLPLVSSRAIVFNQSDPEFSRGQIRRAHDDHHAILEAIVARQGARAEARMRDHALMSAQNKRDNLDAMRRGAFGPKPPGIDLVAG